MNLRSALVAAALAVVGAADFNCDGSVGTDHDILAFFRVLSGGNC